MAPHSNGASPTAAALAVIAPIMIDDAGALPVIERSRNQVIALSVTHVPAKIVNNDVACEYGDTLATLKREKKRLDNQRLDLTKPLRETIDKINKLSAGPIDQLDKIIDGYEFQIVDWTKRERSRLELERQLREQEAEAERERLRAEARRLEEDAARIRHEAEVETARLRKIEDNRIAAEKAAADAANERKRQADLAAAAELRGKRAREAARVEAERKAEVARIAAEYNAENARIEAGRVDQQMKADAEAAAQAAEAYADDTARVAETIEAKEVYNEPRAAGLSTPETWFVVIDDPAQVPEMFKLVDEKALNKLATAQKERFRVPGCHAEKKMGVRSRI